MKVLIAAILIAFVCLMGKEDVAATLTLRRWSTKENIATAILCEDVLTDITKLRRIFVASPGFGSFDESYPTGQKCTLVVTGDSTCQVSTVCPNFDLRPTLCDEEQLVIASGKEDGRPFIKQCGDSVSSDSFIADMDSQSGQSNALRFDLKTASNSEFDRVYKGVRCLVTCVGNEDEGSEETTEPTCERCDCEASNRTNECPTTTCPSITTTCPSIECTTPTTTICRNSTCQPCDSCDSTSTACPSILCPSPPTTTTCPKVDCPTTQGTTCPTSACEPCECPTTTTLAPKCEVSTCPPPPPATKCPEEVCEIVEPTTCPAPPTLAPCPDPACPACPTCPPPPPCPPLPTPPESPVCGEIYTIVSAVDNAKLGSRLSIERGFGPDWFDTFGFDLDRWFITRQGDDGWRITSTSKPSFNTHYYALRVENNTLGLAHEKDAGNKEFKWWTIVVNYHGVTEYRKIKSAYNGNCLTYTGPGERILMLPESNHVDTRQWWKLVTEGHLVGCTRSCKIVNMKDKHLLDIYNDKDVRATTIHDHSLPRQISWDIVHEIWGYRITIIGKVGTGVSLTKEPSRIHLKGFTGDISQNWHFIPVRGTLGREFYLIRNVGTGEYLRNMEGQPGKKRNLVQAFSEDQVDFGDRNYQWLPVPMTWRE